MHNQNNFYNVVVFIILTIFDTSSDNCLKLGVYNIIILT